MCNERESIIIVNYEQDELTEEKLNETLHQLKEKTYYGDIRWPSYLNRDDEEIDGLIEKIDKQLTINNKAFSRFPNDYIHGLMCYKIYEENFSQNEKLTFNDESWLIKDIVKFSVDDKTKKIGHDFYSVLFMNENKKQMVLAFRGFKLDFDTLNENKYQDLSLIIEGILLNSYVPQLAYCYYATERAFKMAKENCCFLSFSGYSNGAWLSEHAIYFCEKVFKTNQTLNMGPFYVQTRAVLFESPGMVKQKTDLDSNIISDETDFDLNQLNIVNYFISPNLGNTSNKHCGRCYRLYIHTDDQESQNEINNYSSVFELLKSFKIKRIEDKIDNLKSAKFIINGLFSMYDKNNLQKMLECFDKSTGKPTYCEQILNWPLLSINFDMQYQRNFSDTIRRKVKKIIEYIPFSSNLQIAQDILESLIGNFASLVSCCLAEKFCPGLHFLLNVVIECLKGNLDLTYFDIKNPEFNRKLTEEEQPINIISEKKPKPRSNLFEIYKEIKSKSSNDNKSALANNLTEELLEQNVKKKFGLKFNTRYERKKVEYYKGFLKISSDLKNNDWILYKLNELKKAGLEQIRASNETLRFLDELKSSFYLIRKDHGQTTKYEMNSLDEKATIEEIKERVFRLKQLFPDIVDHLDKLQRNANLDFKIADDLPNEEENHIKKLDYDQLDSKLFKEDIRKMVIYGPGGIGKSSTACHYGHYLKKKHNFIARKIVVDSKKNIESNFILKLFYQLDLDKNLLTKNDPTLLIDKIKQKLSQIKSKILFIFDNVDYDDVAAFGMIYEDILSNLPVNCYSIVTARSGDEFFLDKFKYRCKLEFMNKQEAKMMIRKSIGEDLIDDGGIDDILDAFGSENYLPLKIEAVISTIRENDMEPLGELIRLVRENAFNQIFDRLFSKMFADAENQNLMIRLALFEPDDLNYSLLFSLDQSAKEDFKRKVVVRLTNLSILKKRREQKYGVFLLSIHRDIQSYLREYVKTKISIDKLEALVDRDFDKFAQLLEDESICHEKILINFNLRNILGYLEQTINLKLINYDQSKIQYLKGLCARWQYKFTESLEYLKNSLELKHMFPSNSEDLSLANTFREIGSAYFYTEKYDESIEYSNRALDLYTNHLNSKHRIEIAKTLVNKGQSLKAQSKYIDALDCLREGLKIYEDTGNKELIANTLNIIGLVQKDLADFDQCFDNLNKALQIYRELNQNEKQEDERIAISYQNIGDYYFTLERYTDSLENALKAYKIYHRVYGSSHQIIAISLKSIGSCYEQMGCVDEALKYFMDSLDVYKKVFNDDPNNSSMAKIYNKIGTIHYFLDQNENAIEHLEKSIDIYKKISSDLDDELFDTNNLLAFAYRDLQNYTKSNQILSESISIYDRLSEDKKRENTAGLTSIYYKLGRNCHSLEEFDRSNFYLKLFLEKISADENDSRASKTITHFIIGKNHHMLGQNDEALRNLNEALQLSIDSDDSHMITQVSDYIASLN